jgi:hypothetical protein
VVRNTVEGLRFTFAAVHRLYNQKYPSLLLGLFLIYRHKNLCYKHRYARGAARISIRIIAPSVQLEPVLLC